MPATLQSMTGFGRGRATRGELSAEVELRSLNSRGLAFKCRLPGDLLGLEPKLEALVRKSVERGRVDLLARLHTGRPRRRPRIDEDVLGVYRRALQRLGGGDAAGLLQLPGVVTVSEHEPSPRSLERLVVAASKEALAALVDARRAEGKRLAAALRRELAVIARHRAAIVRRAPGLVRDHERSLRQRLDELLGERLPADDPVLRREVAVLADRGDVTEELDRLQSHLDAVADALAARGPVGRRLDFLLQEVGREVNTIGSKCGDAKVSLDVVALKGAVEKLREQAANIE